MVFTMKLQMFSFCTWIQGAVLGKQPCPELGALNSMPAMTNLFLRKDLYFSGILFVYLYTIQCKHTFIFKSAKKLQFPASCRCCLFEIVTIKNKPLLIVRFSNGWSMFEPPLPSASFLKHCFTETRARQLLRWQPVLIRAAR